MDAKRKLPVGTYRLAGGQTERCLYLVVQANDRVYLFTGDEMQGSHIPNQSPGIAALDQEIAVALLEMWSNPYFAGQYANPLVDSVNISSGLYKTGGVLGKVSFERDGAEDALRVSLVLDGKTQESFGIEIPMALYLSLGQWSTGILAQARHEPRDVVISPWPAVGAATAPSNRLGESQDNT